MMNIIPATPVRGSTAPRTIHHRCTRPAGESRTYGERLSSSERKNLLCTQYSPLTCTHAALPLGCRHCPAPPCCPHGELDRDLPPFPRRLGQRLGAPRARLGPAALTSHSRSGSDSAAAPRQRILRAQPRPLTPLPPAAGIHQLLVGTCSSRVLAAGICAIENMTRSLEGTVKISLFS